MFADDIAKGSISMENRMGPRIECHGTPYSRFEGDETELVIVTEKLWLERYNLNQFKGTWVIPVVYSIESSAEIQKNKDGGLTRISLWVCNWAQLRFDPKLFDLSFKHTHVNWILNEVFSPLEPNGTGGGRKTNEQPRANEVNREMQSENGHKENRPP